MTPRATGRGAGDAAAVGRAVRTVALRVSLVSASIVVVIVLIAAAFIVAQSKPRELLEPPKPGQHKIYIDGIEAMLAIIVLGAIAIALAGAASWVIARSAVRPLGRALQLQRSFVADASHELRTPLTVLDARLQMLERRLSEDSESRPAVAALRGDARALIDVVTDLLLMAEAGATSISGAGDASIESVAGETVAAMRAVAEPRGVLLESTVTDSPPIAIAATTLRRVLTALLDNAIRYSPHGGTVRVATRVVGRHVELTVTDEGPGITGIEPGRIFDRFARSKTDQHSDRFARSTKDQHSDRFTRSTTEQHGDRFARSTTEQHGDGSGLATSGDFGAPVTTRSFGIGLALVRDVAEQHGGSVAVAETSPEGTTIRVTLPVLRR